MDVDEKAVHDLLLANRPNGADHDPTSCAFCTKAASKEEEKNVTDQAIFTQEQHEQLLASAVETASAEAAATADAEILTLNEQLDAAKAQLVEEESKSRIWRPKSPIVTSRPDSKSWLVSESLQ